MAAADGLDVEANKARIVSEELRILDRIQQFFGLERLTQS
jgi:hypothetical protein